jgi:hypothetical protein
MQSRTRGPGSFVACDLPDLLPAETEEATIAASWHGGHTLDLGYLRQPPRIRAWRTTASDRDMVTVTWRLSTDGDIGFTASPAGQASVPTASFLTAVQTFHADLIEAMRLRIDELDRTGPPDGVHLDLHQLQAEHRDRANRLEQRLHDEPETDWNAIRAGARQLLANE